MLCDADGELVERAKRDPAAFGALYDGYLQPVYRYVYSRVHERLAAEDITEEIFFKALKNIRSYRQVGAPFKAWLYRIAAHAVADHFRQRKTVSLSTDADLSSFSSDVAELVVARDRQRRVWEAIDQLPRQQRAAMTLKYSADLSNAEIGRAMGKTRAATKLLVHRAVQRLRLQLVPLEA